MPGDAASIEIARINAQAQLGSAGEYADASRFGAKTGANASMYNTDTDAATAAAKMASEEGMARAKEAGEMARQRMSSGASIANQLMTTYPQSGFEIGKSMIGKLGYSKGTPRVPGQGDGTVDTVDAKLAPGEAVLNKAAAEMLGRGLIDLLNKHGMLQMGMPEPDADDMEEPEGYATGCSNVQKYAAGTAYVEPLAVQRPQVPQAATFTLGMMGGNQGAPAIGGGGWADPGAMERARTSAPPRPMMAPPPPVQSVSPIPTIDHGPAPSTPDQSATAWGNRPAPAPAAPPVNTGWADPGAQENGWRHTAGQAPAAPGASAPPPRMINGMTGVAPQGIGAPGQRPTMPAPAPSPINNNMSFDQAFKAARDAAGGAGGSFNWHGKDYQTNVKGEAYSKAPKPVF